MTLLAELFKQLDTTPEAGGPQQAGTAVGAVQVGVGTPTTRTHPPAPVPAPATTAAPTVPPSAAERPAEVRRNAWTITRGGRPICTVCGAPMTCTEAMAEARWRWPDAEIE